MIVIKNTADVGRAFNEAMDVYKQNFLLLLLSTLVTCAVSFFSLGICTGPMMVGMAMLLFRLLRKDPNQPKVKDAFAGFRKFVVALIGLFILAMILGAVDLIVNILPIIGQVISAVLSLAVTPAVMVLAVGSLADGEVTIGEVIAEPLKHFPDGRFWSLACVCFVATLIGALGALLFGIGVFLTLPFAWLMMLSGYEQLFREPPAEVTVEG